MREIFQSAHKQAFEYWCATHGRQPKYGCHGGDYADFCGAMGTTKALMRAFVDDRETGHQDYLKVHANVMYEAQKASLNLPEDAL